MKPKTTLAIISLTFTTNLYAATLNVPAQYPTIQGAIVAAVAGDTVLVTPSATYYENLDFLGKDITVRTPNPVNDRLTTIINGNANGSVVRFISSETRNAKLEGFTLTNGSGTSRDWSYYATGPVNSGGGILCDNPIAFGGSLTQGSSPTIDYIIIENCTAEYGAGIASWILSRPAISNTIIRNNIASEEGGGISAYEAFNADGLSDPITLTNIEVSHNSGGLIGGSGVVANFTSRVIMMNCTVADNTGSNTDGEALFRANGGVFEIYNSIFWGINSDLLFDQGGDFALSMIDFSDAPNSNGPFSVVTNVLNVDPLFANAPAGNYHLSNASPCIDAAIPLNAPVTDLEGNPRNAVPDMGAYEVIYTGIKDYEQKMLSVFPNPAMDEVTVFSKPYAEIKLKDITGKTTTSKNADASGKIVFDLKEIAKGVYFLSLNNISVSKLVKL